MIIRTEAQDKGNIDLVFWPGSLTLLGASLEQQLQAAAAGRFTSMAISVDTYRQAIAAGYSASGILELAAERGLRINQLDGVTSWTPYRFPAELPVEVRERFDVSPEESLDVAAELGVSTVIAMGVFRKGELTTDELIPMFGDFCDKAKSRNLRVDIEPASMWGIPTVDMAWDIVRNADYANSGLLIDTWHLQKGSPHFEDDLLLLETIPSERLANIQLSDSLLAAKADTLFEDCMRFRKFPGEGEQSLARMVSIIAKKGSLRCVGPEVFSDEVGTLGIEEVGTRAGNGTRAVLQAAGLRDN